MRAFDPASADASGSLSRRNAHPQNKLDKLERLGIAAYVFKSKSPSCGWKNVQKFNRSGRCLSASGQGIFAALVKRRFPNIPVIEETDFPELLDMMD